MKFTLDKYSSVGIAFEAKKGYSKNNEMLYNQGTELSGGI